MRASLSLGLQSAPALNDSPEELELALKEKRDLARRLSEALHEIAEINDIYLSRRAQFELEQNRLNTEIEKLRKLLEFSNRRNSKSVEEGAGVQSLLETREKLIRQEFEKKYQDLVIEVRQQRKKYTDQVEEMKQQLSECICKGSR